MPAQVHVTSTEGVFKAEFVPRSVGEHRVMVTVKGVPTAGSPYAAKVSIHKFSHPETSSADTSFLRSTTLAQSK